MAPTTANPAILRARYLQLRSDYIEMGVIEHLAERAAAIDVERECEERGEVVPEYGFFGEADVPLSEQLEAGHGGMRGSPLDSWREE